LTLKPLPISAITTPPGSLVAKAAPVFKVF
jgi:hypothetical protein